MDKRRTHQHGHSAATSSTTDAKHLRKAFQWMDFHEATVRFTARGKPVEKSVRLANIPKNGLSRVVLLQLRTCFSQDVLTTEDFESYLITEISCPALAPVTDGVPPPACPGPARFRRLRVRMRLAGDVVEVANIPATAEGIQLMMQLVRDYDGVFYTTDFGMRELHEIDQKSIEELNPPMTECG